MNCASKEGAGLYNKRLTANLEAVEGANDPSKYVFHDKAPQYVGIESAIKSHVRFPPVRYHSFQ